MVAVGNGVRLKIDNAGATFLHNLNSSFKFHKNVLHCPNAFANLLSIQRFCTDNDYHFILTSSHFFCEGQSHQSNFLGRQE
jgi:hypothetical protein